MKEIVYVLLIWGLYNCHQFPKCNATKNFWEYIPKSHNKQDEILTV